MKKNIFIYLGGKEICEKGAVGTHSKGIIEAVINSGFFDDYYVIGSNIDCINNKSIHLLDIKPSKVNLKLSLYSKYINHNKQVANLYNNLERLLLSLEAHNVTLYHRYGIFNSYPIIKKLKTNFPYLKIILEYNDLTNEQLKFANSNKQWGFIGGFIRTNYFTQKLIEYREKYCFTKATLNIGVTDALVDYIKLLSPKAKTLVLQNGVSEKLITKHKNKSKIELRKELKLNIDDFIIAHVGTLTYWDGLLELIDVIAELKSENIIVNFIIVGSGSCELKLKELTHKLNLNNQIKFIPPLNHEEALKYIIVADIIPLLKTISSYQLSPMKYYEALGLGKPLIATDIDYINSIKNSDFGIVVSNPLNNDEIKKALIYYYKNKSKLTMLKSKIINYTLNNHTWDIRVKVILKTLNS